MQHMKQNQQHGSLIKKKRKEKKRLITQKSSTNFKTYKEKDISLLPKEKVKTNHPLEEQFLNYM